MQNQNSFQNDLDHTFNIISDLEQDLLFYNVLDKHFQLNYVHRTEQEAGEQPQIL